MNCTQTMFHKWGEFLGRIHRKKLLQCPSRPILQLQFLQSKSRTFGHRETYNGLYVYTMIQDTKRKTSDKTMQTIHPDISYTCALPISKEKYDDIQHLKQFCRPDAQQFFSSLTTTLDVTAEADDVD